MWKRQGLLSLGLVMFFGVLLAPSATPAGKDTPKKEGKVAGILIDKNADSIVLKADGEDKPVKYTVDKSNKKLDQALKMIFGAGRVQVTYKQAGDAQQLLTIKRQVLKEKGTITGKVVKVYNNFWVEVKPKNGPADAFAPGINYKDKAFMDRLKALQPGDSVTIDFYTDFERHRILRLQKN